jgi:ribosomal protein S18 acetylase RimI-like enzyme
MKISFKQTKSLDFDKVIDIFFEAGFLKHQNKREIYKKAIKKAFLNSDYVVSAWDKEKLIGFSRIITDKSLFAPIWNLIVKPEYQGKGIRKSLMQKCLNKYPKLHFFIIADKKVVKFYEKLGFKLHPYGMYLEKGKQVCVIYN